MMEIIPYAIPLLLIIFSLVRPKSVVLYWIIMIYIGILITFNTWSNDYAVNQWMYEEIFHGVWSNFEPATLLLAKICNRAGLSFTAYRGVISIIFVVVFTCGVFKITNKKALAAAIALIFPCVGFASGLRSAIAFAICIYSYHFLIGEKTSKKRFVICNLIGAMFHFSAVFNLIFILYDKKLSKKKYLLIVFAEMAGLLLLKSNALYHILVKIVPTMKSLEWIEMGRKESPSLIAFLVYSVTYILVFFIFYYILRYQSPQVRKNMKSIIMLNLLYIPLLSINFTYERALIYGMYFLFMYGIKNLRTSNNRMSRLYSRNNSINKGDGIIILSTVFMNLISCYWINNNLYFPILINNSLYK